MKLALGATVHDPTDPMGKMFFNIVATFAEFEADLIKMRTREGMAIAKAKGKLRGKRPKLSEKQQKELCRMHDTGEYSISDLLRITADRLSNIEQAKNRLTYGFAPYRNRPDLESKEKGPGDPVQDCSTYNLRNSGASPIRVITPPEKSKGDMPPDATPVNFAGAFHTAIRNEKSLTSKFRTVWT